MRHFYMFLTIASVCGMFWTAFAAVGHPWYGAAFAALLFVFGAAYAKLLEAS